MSIFKKKWGDMQCNKTLMDLHVFFIICVSISVDMVQSETTYSYENNSLINWSNTSAYYDSDGFSESNSSGESWLENLNRENLKHSMTCTVIITILYSIVFLVGIFGNSVVILVISLKSHMRTVTNLFILNLAVADMFVLLFCLPATLIASIYRPWILGSFMCWGVAYVQGDSVVASAYSLAAISVDRCKAICQHTMSTRGFSKHNAIIVIVLIWVLAMTIPLPWSFVFVLQVSQSNKHTVICTERWDSEVLDIFYFIFGNLFCCYILPCIFIASANVKIWLKVSRRSVPQGCTPSASSPASMLIQQSHRRTRRGVGKMLGMVTLTYLISWLPLYVFATRVKVSKAIGESEKKFLWVVIPLSQWLAYGNSCVNPVFYAFFNSNFRRMGKSYLPTWILRKFSPKSDILLGRQATLVVRGKSVKEKRYGSVVSATSTAARTRRETIISNIQSERNKQEACKNECSSNHEIFSCDEKSDRNEVNRFPVVMQSCSMKITAV